MSKRCGPLRFKGSTQEKSPSEIFRFGYGKAESDKKVPDPVGSGFLYYIKSPNDNRLGPKPSDRRRLPDRTRRRNGLKNEVLAISLLVSSRLFNRVFPGKLRKFVI
jgi:hypothetical protein